MTRNLLTVTILMLFVTGCIPRTPYGTAEYEREDVVYTTPTSRPISTPRYPVQQQPRYTPPPPPQRNNTVSSSSIRYQKLQTIQGPKLTVGMHPKGFIFPDYQGKVVLLQVFGKECPHCFKEMPIINQLRSKYRDRFQVVAIQAQRPMSRMESTQLINRFQMYYPIIEKNNANDILYYLKNTYGWQGILPYGLLIKNGVIEYSYSGETDPEEIVEMEEIIQGLS